jgi:hypothetical protein
VIAGCWERTTWRRWPRDGGLAGDSADWSGSGQWQQQWRRRPAKRRGRNSYASAHSLKRGSRRCRTATAIGVAPHRYSRRYIKIFVATSVVDPDPEPDPQGSKNLQDPELVVMDPDPELDFHLTRYLKS